MVVLFFELLCFASCAFLICVFVQLWREEKQSRAVMRPTSQAGRPQLRLVRSQRRPASLSESTSGWQGQRGISGAAVALLVTGLHPWAAHCQEKPTSAKASEERERVLLERIDRLERRLAELEARMVDKASINASSEPSITPRSEEHTSELQSQSNLVCRLLLEKKKKIEKNKKNFRILNSVHIT